MKTKSTTSDMLAIAKEKGLFGMDREALDSKVAQLKAALDAFKKARADAGLVVEPEDTKVAEALYCRACLTSTEHELVHAMSGHSDDKDALRPKVQSAIRRLRDAGFREKRAGANGSLQVVLPSAHNQMRRSATLCVRARLALHR